MTQIAFPVHPAWKLGSTGRPGPMLAHQRMPWKPTELPHNPNLGQSGDAVKAVALSALFLPTAAAAAVALVGFRLGSKDEEGWASVLGYVVGALGGISALMGVLAMLGVAVTPFTLAPKGTEVAVPVGATA